MIEMLQRKFVLTAMTAVSVLLLVLLGAINLINGMVGEPSDRQNACHAFRKGGNFAAAARSGGKRAEGSA